MKKHVVIALLIPIICLAVLELSLRIYGRCNPGFAIMPDGTYLKYRGRPNSLEFNGFRLNSRGFKDVEFNEIKPPDVFRIIAIGDSQTYGAVPYQRTYVFLLGKEIRRSVPDVEIYNLGVPSAAPIDYLSILINEGLRLHPDMVLLTLFLGDDFNRGGTRKRLHYGSAAATFLHAFIVNRIEPDGKVFGTGTYRDDTLIRNNDAYIHFLVDTQLNLFHKGNHGFRRDVESSLSIVRRMREICNARGVALVVVACPADVQLYPEARHNAIARRGGNPDEYDFYTLNGMLHEELSGMGIPFLNLLDGFKKRQRFDRRIFNQRNDPHWNLYGSMVAAEIAGSWLSELIRPGANRREH